MNRRESNEEKLQRQQKAIADLRLEQSSSEETQKAVIEEAARRATADNWSEMPEDERQRVVEEIMGFEALTFQLSIFRRGWTTGSGAQRIEVDPEAAGPRVLIRAYATAEAETVRMRNEVVGPIAEDGPQLTLEEKLRRHMHPELYDQGNNFA